MPNSLAPQSLERGPIARRSGAWFVLGGIVVTASIAIGSFVALRPPPPRGEITAKQTEHVTLGADGSAIVEPGARLAWAPHEVTQSSGRVLYRIAPGHELRVRTAAGQVVLAPGYAAIHVAATRTFVTVTEGHATIIEGDATAREVAAGESAELGGGSNDDVNDALSEANENLVDQVRDYKKRLDELAKQKDVVENKLKTTEEKLAAKEGKARRDEYDLTKEDWVELAKQGMVKFRMPCPHPDGWTYPPEQLSKLGLAPSDRETLTTAHRQSIERVWAAVRPICQEVIGAPIDVIESMGLWTCRAVIQSKDGLSRPFDRVNEPYQAVAEMRAGLRPLPGPTETVAPLVRLLLILTQANADFEATLAKDFGPEEAHRIAYADNNMCRTTATLHEGDVKPRP